MLQSCEEDALYQRRPAANYIIRISYVRPRIDLAISFVQAIAMVRSLWPKITPLNLIPFGQYGITALLFSFMVSIFANSKLAVFAIAAGVSSAV